MPVTQLRRFALHLCAPGYAKCYIKKGESLKHIFLIFLLTFPVLVNANVDEVVMLDVPVVKQGRALCGPATIEMVFRYWGITDYDQYDIAYNILLFNPNAKRVKKSKILQSKVINWKLYPGTGTSTMRDFLKQLSTTKNHKFKSISTNYKYAEKQKKRIWGIVKEYLSNGIPVIVHQYWKGKGTNGHYRVVTGFNEKKKVVYLNDANPGKKLTQSYREFFKLWNVDEPWLHYNAIVFNAYGDEVNFSLSKYEYRKN
jgi:hypothetical protein